MKRLLFAALGAGLALTAAASTADAAQGCGPGGHRGPYGGCRANYGPGPVVVGGPALGIFYPGRGYWTATAIGAIATLGTAAGATTKPVKVGREQNHCSRQGL